MKRYILLTKIITISFFICSSLYLLPKDYILANSELDEAHDVWDATDVSIFGEFALRDGVSDSQSENLQYIINEAAVHNKQIFVPGGEYILDKTVDLKENTRLNGDLNQPTILRTTNNSVELSDSRYADTNGIEIKNFFFDGVSIFTRRSHNIVIQNNIFYNPLRLYPIRLQASKGADLSNNIFMRDILHATPDTENRAIWIGGFSTATVYEYMEDVTIKNNLFGVKLNELDAIKSFSNPGIVQTIERLQKAQELEKIRLENNEQNYLSTGVNSYSNLSNALIKDNFFYQMYENDDRYGVVGDHAIYLRGSQNIHVIGNHLRGLHNGPYGAFKFKPGREITIMNNYLRNTGIIMYETPEFGLGDSHEEGAVAELSYWLVANNIFDFKEWQDRYAIGIEYNRHTGVDNVYNGVFIDNKFVNYHNIPSNRRRELLILNSHGEGFKGESTYVAGNTRDDTEDQLLSVEYWSLQDALMMPNDWTQLVDNTIYEQYKDSKIPIRNTLPIARNIEINLGQIISAYDLVDHTHDADEAQPDAIILNPEVLTNLGEQKVQVLLTYEDRTTVTIQSIVNVTSDLDEPTDPDGPTNPTGPTETIDPTGPTNPAEPTNPITSNNIDDEEKSLQQSVDSPNTGDNQTNLLYYVTLLFVTSILLINLLFKKNRL